ncbi:MAG: hypothetical protein P4L50_29965 [Anaerolineaceae bacterium]|nr:hypothetical protein [Anaerolineaceae bacterium]
MNGSLLKDFFTILSIGIVLLTIVLAAVRWLLGGEIVFKLWSIISLLILVIGMDAFLVGGIGLEIRSLSIGIVLGVICPVLTLMAILRWIIRPIK